jgi:predicted phosphodiesterase
MRWGVVSDIHGNLPALLAVVADAEARGGVDGWLNLGDILSGPLWPAETADWLMARDWPTIAGNHERQVLTHAPERMAASDRHAAERLQPRHHAWLAGLPPTLDFAAGARAVHGSPGSDLVYLLETVTPQGLRQATPAEVLARLAEAPSAAPPPALLLCGHSHLARDVVAGTTRVVNPGSVGLQAYDDAHPHFHVAEAGSPHARYACIRQLDGQGWAVELRQVAYDWQAAAAQAEANGRGDWADALSTGRVGRMLPG